MGTSLLVSLPLVNIVCITLTFGLLTFVCLSERINQKRKNEPVHTAFEHDYALLLVARYCEEGAGVGDVNLRSDVFEA